MSVTPTVSASAVRDKDIPTWVNKEAIPLLRALRDAIEALGVGSATPTGPAGGQLSGTYPDPSVAGVTETDGPTALAIGDVLDGEFLKRVGAAIVGATPSTAPTGAAGGDLAGTYPNPEVAALHETSGPTKLTLGAVADGAFLKRSGSTAVGDATVVTTTTGADNRLAVFTGATAVEGTADATFDPSGNGLDLNVRVNGSGVDLNADTTGWPLFCLRLDNSLRWLMAIARASNDVVAGSNAGDVVFRTQTSSRVLFTFDGGGAIRHEWVADGNVAFGLEGSYGGGTKVIFIANASAVPTTNPSGGGILYAEGGALKWRGSGGTVTTIGPV